MVFMVLGEHVTHRLSLCPVVDAENTRRLVGGGERPFPTGVVMDLLCWSCLSSWYHAITFDPSSSSTG